MLGAPGASWYAGRMDTARKTLRWLPAVIILILVPIIALVTGMGTPAEATMDIPSPLPSPPLVSEHRSEAQDEPSLVEALTPDNDALVRYLYDSMRVWTKLADEDADQAALAKAEKLTAQGTWPVAADAQHKVEASIQNHKEARARYASIASDIVTVVRSERPAFPSDENRSRTAVLVATVAFYEAAFMGYVDQGLCNDWKWRHPTTTGPGAVSVDEVKQRMGILKAGSCDGGWAFSMWQIHPFDSSWHEGMVLLDDAHEWSFASYVHDGEDRPIILGKDMIADRRVAARMALHMLRRSLGAQGAGNLCGYTGETQSCWKGALRQNFASDWSAKHPFVPER